MDIDSFTTSTGITAVAAVLSNLIVILANMRKDDLTPQQKVALGTTSAIVIFFIGLALFPQAYQGDGQKAFLVLMEAIIAVLASAGVPVYGEAAALQRQARKPQPMAQSEDTPDDQTERFAQASEARTWGVWSR